MKVRSRRVFPSHSGRTFKTPSSLTAHNSWLGEQIKQIEDSLPILEHARDNKLAKLCNMLDTEVPKSKEEDEDNVVCKLWPLPEGVCCCNFAVLETRAS